MNVKGSYKVIKWEEAPYENISANSKLSKASVEYQFTGEMEGTARVEYLMFYSYFDPADPHDSKAAYAGLIRFEGKLLGRSGSFVMIDNGTFQDGAANSRLLIANGSGAGALQGITGNGNYRADRSGYTIELDYALP